MLHPVPCTKLSLLSSHKLEQSLKFSVPNLLEDLLDKVGECNNVERFSSQVVKTLELARILDHSSYTTDVQVKLIFAKFFKSNIFLDEAEDSNHGSEIGG